MDARVAAVLLDEFKKLPAPINRPRTFMEIGGYPHYENVCSNFLAFFFDPEGEHGLGSLFLDALFSSLSITGEKAFGGNVSVEREVGTAAGNRIDVLITSDSHAILIENKIFAAVANPFADYAAYLDGLKKENNVKVLLALYPSGEGAEWCFRNLTYAEFVSAVRSALGHHVARADTRYLTLMLDFLNTLENLGEGTRMDLEYIKLLAERGDEVDEFLWYLKEVRDELRRKVQELASLTDVSTHQNVEQIPWRPNVPLEHLLQHRIHLDENSYIAFDTMVSPGGWEFWIYPRKGITHSTLEDLLNELEIPFELDDGFIYHPVHFDYDEDLSHVTTVIQELVGKLSDSVG